MKGASELSEGERLRFMRLPPPPAEGTQMRRAVELRAAGTPYQDIAAELAVDRTTAFHYVREGLDRFRGEEIRNADLARKLHLLRLDALLAGQWQKAMRGDVPATATCLKIMERQARLLGLDAPIRVDIEPRIRQMAVEEGLDPDQAVEEARRIIKARPW
jgi:hypothetical protein